MTYLFCSLFILFSIFLFLCFRLSSNTFLTALSLFALLPANTSSNHPVFFFPSKFPLFPIIQGHTFPLLATISLLTIRFSLPTLQEQLFVQVFIRLVTNIMVWRRIPTGAVVNMQATNTNFKSSHPCPLSLPPGPPHLSQRDVRLDSSFAHLNTHAPAPSTVLISRREPLDYTLIPLI